MNKLLKKLLCTTISLVLIICMLAIPATKVHAASADFTISVSSTSVYVGDSVTVTVSLNCDSTLGAYSYSLTYDSDILEYTSGSGYGGSGTVTYAGYGDGNSSSAYATFSFSAIGSGDVYIQTSNADVYTWGEKSCSISNAGASISVLSNNTEPETTEEQTEVTTEAQTTESENTSTEQPDTEETSEDTTEETASTCLLSKLSVNPGKLTPVFSKNVFDYSIEVPFDTKQLNIEALPENENAAVDIAGNSNFEPGKEYSVEITVTSDDESKQLYTIKVTCKEEEIEKIYAKYDDKTLYFAYDYSKLNIPEGFSAEKCNYKGKEIITYKSPNALINCAYLIDEEGNGSWYIVDLLTGELTPMLQVQSNYNTYIIKKAPDNSLIPEGFTLTTYEFGNIKVDAYKRNEQDSIILIYAINPAGSEGWYFYDTNEGSFLRLDGFTTVTPEPVEEKNDFLSLVLRYKTEIMLGAIALLLLILLIIIICFSKTKKKLKKYINGELDLTDAAATDNENDESISKMTSEATNSTTETSHISPVITSTAPDYEGPLLSNPLAKPAKADVEPEVEPDVEPEADVNHEVPAEASGETPDIKKAPAIKTTPAVIKAPAANTAPESKTAPTAENVPEAEVAPEAENVPEAENTPATENAPTTEPAPNSEDMTNFTPLNTTDLSEIINIAKTIVDNENK